MGVSRRNRADATLRMPFSGFHYRVQQRLHNNSYGGHRHPGAGTDDNTGRLHQKRQESRYY